MLLWCTLQIPFIKCLFKAVCKQHMVRSFSPSFNFPAGVFPCSYVVMSKKHVTDLPSVFLFFTRAMVNMVQWFHLSVVALVGSSQLTLELDWALPALGSGSSLNNDPCNSGFFKFFPSSNLGSNPPTHHYLDTCFAGLENPWVSCGAAKPSAWQSNRAAFTVGLGPASQWARIQGWFLAVFCSFNIESWQYVSWRRLQMTCCMRLALAAQTHPSATALPPSSSAPGNFYS